MKGELAAVLRWITELLRDLRIPYQAVGGLAAISYGSTRSLVDIDVYVPDDTSLERLAAAAQKHLIREPAHYHDEHWDLTFLKLEWAGWTIEAAAASTARVWDRRSGSWRPAAIRFNRSETRLIEGVQIQVMPRAQLVEYKEGLGRDVDHLDVAGLRATDEAR